MNRIHRVVINRRTGCAQVAHELARSGPGRSARQAVVVAGLVGLFAIGPAWADGGAGGGGIPGGTPQSPNGANGDLLGTSRGGGGGSVSRVTGLGGAAGRGSTATREGSIDVSAGAPGGIGGNAGLVVNQSSITTVDAAGTAGGVGGNGVSGGIPSNDPDTGELTGTYGSGGGGGGEGGMGVLVNSVGVSLRLDLRASGGTGGLGGVAGFYSEEGSGSGGDGGAGVVMASPGSLTVLNASSLGGAGGAGGAASDGRPVNHAGHGGRGGDGVLLVQGGAVSLVGVASVQGGVGGDGGGAIKSYNQAGNASAGGAGIRSDGNLTATIGAGTQVLGAHGGNAGQGGFPNLGGSNGGSGGAGILATAGGTIDNNGRIVGGDAGIQNRNVMPSPFVGGVVLGVPGTAGAAIEGAGLTILNNGTLRAGLEVDGSLGTAVRLTGGSNLLRLNAQSLIEGAVDVRPSASLGIEVGAAGRSIDWLVLGGDVQISTGGQDLAITGAISGDHGIQKRDAGTLNLTNPQANTFSGGMQILDGVVKGGVSSFGSGAINVGLTGAVQVDESGAGVLANRVTGAGSLIKSGNGTLAFGPNANNDYTGTTVVQAGTLVAAVGPLAHGIGTGAVQVERNAALQLDSQNILAVFASPISGEGRVVKSVNSRLTLFGANTYTGGTEIQGGTLVAEPTALGFGDIVNNGILALDGAGQQERALAGAIVGTGAVEKTGSGAVLLAPVNSYTGGTTIRAGRLVGGSTSFGTGDIHLGPLNTVAELVLELRESGNGTLRNTISGGGDVVKSGAGTLTLGAANSYIGTTTVSGGVLAVSNTNQIGQGQVVLDGGVLAGNNLVLTRNISLGVTGGGLASSNQFTLQGAIGGSGALVKSGFGEVTLAGNNFYSGATQVAAGTLITGVANLGRTSGIAIDAGAALRLQDAADATLDKAISGGGTLIKTGAGTTTLSAFNSFNGGLVINQGTIRAGVLGLGSGTIQNAGALIVDEASSFVAVPGRLNGTGTLTKLGSGTVALAAGSNYSGDTTIQAGRLLGTATSFGSSRIIDNAELQLDQGFDATFTNTLTGAGSLIKTGAGTLTLTDATRGFAGAVSVQSGTLAVADAGQLGTGNALELRAGGKVRVTSAGNLDRALSLGLGGGGLQVDGDLRLTGVVSGAGGLTKTGAGTLTLSTPNSYQGGTTVSGGTLAVSADGQLGAAQGGVRLDGGTLRTTTAMSSVRAIELGAAGGTVQADGDLSLTGPLGGAGAFTKTGAGTLMLAGVNDHQGGTSVQGGTLAVAADHNLGAAGTAVHLAGGTLRTTTALAIDRPIDVQGQGNVIQAEQALQLTGPVTGQGSLTKRGTGTLALTQPNTYEGGTALKQGRLDVGHNQALGTGELAMDDGTTLGVTANGLVIGNAIRFTGAADPVVDTGAFNATLAGAITGAADLSKIGKGTLTLSGANVYTGTTTLAEGVLKAGAAGVLSAASAHAVNAGATLDLGGFAQSVASLRNAGTVSLSGAAPGNTLTVRGPYVGEGGTLKLATVLGDSQSRTDRLVLDGAAAVASGRTTVQVLNAGGLGAVTAGSGIEVIAARNGASTTAQGTKDAFALAGGHVDAGVYEYRLQPGDAGGQGESWYLRSTTPVVAVPAPVIDVPAPATSQSQVAAAIAPTVAVTPVAELPTYRTEVPLVAALPEQLRQSQQLMLATMHQRVGAQAAASRSTLLAQGRAEGAASDAGGAADLPGERRGWARVLGGERQIDQRGTVTPRSEGHLSGLQGGTDLWVAGSWRAGLYAGQLEGNFDVSGFARGFEGLHVGRSHLRSQYLGGYATWSQDGWYVDAVLQGARHDIELRPLDNPKLSARARGLSASVEVGRRIGLGAGWSVEPQLQLVYERLRYDDLQLGLTRVSQESGSRLSARLGARLEGQIDMGVGRLKPYGRVDYWHSRGGEDRANYQTLAGLTTIGTRTGGGSAEAAVGATLELNPHTSLYGEVGKRWAAGGDARVRSSIEAQAGVRIRW